MFKKTTIALLAVIAVMTLGVGVIFAQGPDEDEGRRGRQGHRGGHNLIETIAEVTETEIEEVIQARHDGTSFNDYITSNGGDAAEVKATVLAEAEERLAEHVADEDITQEEADERLAELSEKLDEVMASTEEFEPRDNDRRGNGPRGRSGNGPRGGNVIDTISEVTGLEAEEIFEALQNGGTLADVITDNGGDVEAVREALLDEYGERIDEILEGEFDGRRGPHGNNSSDDAPETDEQGA